MYIAHVVLAKCTQLKILTYVDIFGRVQIATQKICNRTTYKLHAPYFDRFMLREILSLPFYLENNLLLIFRFSNRIQNIFPGFYCIDNSCPTLILSSSRGADTGLGFTEILNRRIQRVRSGRQ